MLGLYGVSDYFNEELAQLADDKVTRRHKAAAKAGRREARTDRIVRLEREISEVFAKIHALATALEARGAVTREDLQVAMRRCLKLPE